MYGGRSEGAAEPAIPPTETRTSTVPVPGGLTTTHVCGELQLVEAAAFAPNRTIVAPGNVLNPLPLNVTGVPPATGPNPGLTVATEGGCAALAMNGPRTIPT